MELMDTNLEPMDCTIVAIFNALTIAGVKTSYKRIKNKCLRKGWYDPNVGFYNNMLPEALTHFGLEYVPVPEKTTTKQLFRKIRRGKNFLLITSPAHGGIGHAMLATKGSKGVKVYNSVFIGRGWRTISRDVNSNYIKMTALEIKRAAA